MKKLSVIIVLTLLLVLLTACNWFGYPVGDRVDQVIATMDSLESYTLEYEFTYQENEEVEIIGILTHKVTITYDMVNHIRYFQFPDHPEDNFYVHENGFYLEIYRLYDGLWFVEAIPKTRSNDQENEFLDFIYTAMNKDGDASFDQVFPGDVSISTKVLFDDMIATMELEWFNLGDIIGNPKVKENEDVSINAEYIVGDQIYFNWYGILITTLFSPHDFDPSSYLITIKAYITDIPLLELPVPSN